jgi:hypothetical protein
LSTPIKLKDSPNGLGFCGLALEPHGSILPGRASVTEAPATCRQSFQGAPLHSSVRFRRQLPPVHGVNQAVHTYQQVRLRAERIHTLRDRNNTNTREGKPFEKIQCICQAPR